MLPGPVLVMLRVLSWLSLPLWPAGAASAFALDIRAVVIVSSLALAATLAALTLHMHDRVDARITKGLAAQRERQDALLHAMEAVAGPAEPSPQLRVVPPAVPEAARRAVPPQRSAPGAPRGQAGATTR